LRSAEEQHGEQPKKKGKKKKRSAAMQARDTARNANRRGGAQ
jgi:hypothetical protein